MITYYSLEHNVLQKMINEYCTPQIQSVIYKVRPFRFLFFFYVVIAAQFNVSAIVYEH